MGELVEGRWQTEAKRQTDAQGRFQRHESQFRERVTADGASGFRAAPGRYHLYVSLACPWACRTLMARKLKGLEDVIGVSVTSPDMLEDGWEYPEGEPNYGYRYHHQLYTAAAPSYTGRVTVPVLWDKKRLTIVSNESSEILRMLNEAFESWADASIDLYPSALRDEIDALDRVIYDDVNNGVYKAGFAATQAAYEQAFDALFATLDQLDERLATRRYLVGNRLTEVDLRLFATLIRFDAVYYSHFKCNRQRIADYPQLSGYTRDLYQTPGIAETVDFAHIKQHYYGSHLSLNPRGIVPKGPRLDLDRPHGREHLGAGPGSA